MTPTPEQLELRRDLVANLRSGEYEQFDGALANDSFTAFCCLGVACERAITLLGEDVTKRVAVDPGCRGTSRSGYATPNGGVAASFLPQSVAEAYGWDDVSPLVSTESVDTFVSDDHEIGDGEEKSLAGLNDAGVPFHVIADVIEAEYITPYEQEGAGA